jgi:DNA-binding PadR family transcriptional regulator
MGGPSAFLGQFELAVLLAVAHLDAPYGMTVRRDIEARTGRDVSIGSVYITLARLKAKGLVADSGVPRDVASGARARRVFRLTAAGARSLAEAREIHRQLWAGVSLTPGRRP